MQREKKRKGIKGKFPCNHVNKDNLTKCATKKKECIFSEQVESLINSFP